MSHELRESVVAVVAQMEQVLDQTALVYACRDYGASIGQHTRHIIDHFDALQAGTTSGTVDYDLRSRDSLCETSVVMAKQRLQCFARWLGQSALADQPLLVRTEVSVDEQCALACQSSLYRELAFVISHAVHHLATIRAIAAEHGVVLDQKIGVAPSTASYQRAQKTG